MSSSPADTVRRRLLCAGAVAGLSPWSAAQGSQERPAYDAIVVGSGFAGMTAAITAAERGARVLLVSADDRGGNSARSYGIFNAFDPLRQEEQKIADTPEKHFRQMWSAGGERGNRELAHTVCYGAYYVMRWLESYGIELADRVQTAPWGLYPRAHRLVHGSAAAIATLHRVARQLDVQWRSRVSLIELIRENSHGAVQGVAVRGEDGRREVIYARLGVILATGGFAANQALCERHQPRLHGTLTTNDAGADGSGLLVARRAGASLVGMDAIQCQLGLVSGTSPLVSNPAQFVYADAQARRFIAEDRSADDVCEALLDRPEKKCWVIMRGQSVAFLPQRARDRLEQYRSAGDIVHCRSAGQAAQAMAVSERAVDRLIEDYNAAVKAHADPLGKSARALDRPLDKDDLLVGTVHAVRHHTAGGIQIDASGRVLDRRQHVIPQLFAAGECVAGVHGTHAVSGDAITAACVIGRIAATTLAGATVSPF